MKYALSPLKSGHALQKPNSPGWNGEYNLELLNRIADNLESSQSNFPYQDITAVPDIWARVQLFEEALANNLEEIIGEWRGLLALFGLQGLRAFSLRVDIIDLSKVKGAIEIMREFLPGDALLGLDWDHLASIKIDENLVGLVIPSVLVCSSANPGTQKVRSQRLSSSEDRKKIAEIVPWYDSSSGRFSDPCKNKAICAAEMAAMYQFLDILHNSVSAGTDSTKNTFLNPLLRKYKIDCLDHYNKLAANGPRIDQISFETAGMRMPLPRNSIYNSLSQGYQPTFDFLTYRSDLQIRGRPKLMQLGFKGAILCDPMAAPPSLAASQVRVWGTLCLSAVSTNPGRVAQCARDAVSAGYLWLTQDSLFTRKVVRTKDGKVFPPLTASILMLLSAGEIRHRIQIEGKDDVIVVKLTVEVVDHQDQTRSVTLQKTYQGDGEIEKREYPNILAQWPIVPETLWKQSYFLFHEGHASTRTVPGFPCSLSALLAHIGKSPNLQDWNRLATFLDSSQAQIQRSSGEIPNLPMVTWSEHAILDNQLTSFKVIYRTPYAPEILVCNNGIMFSPSSVRDPGNSTVDIAVDFGTSNTMLSCRFSDDGELKPLSFDAVAASLFESVIGVDNGGLVREFLPMTSFSSPFMTAIRSRNAGLGDGPIWSDLIYYLNNPRRALDDVYITGKSSLRFNFKWSQDPSDRRRVLLFLSQIVMQSLAEVVRKGIQPSAIRWYFSYPESYKSEHLRDFKRIVNLAVGQATGTNVQINFVQESLATAYYFAHNPKENVLDGFYGTVITLDIGGGSSDITIWKDQSLLWRSSIRLAGKNILTKFLVNNWKTFFESLATGAKMDFQELFGKFKEVVNPDASKLETALEVVINSSAYDSAMRERYGLISAGAGAPLAHVGQLSLAGILYYIGIVLRGLSIDFSAGQSPLKLCLGGRGSRLYQTVFGPGAKDLQDSLGPIVNVLSAAYGKVVFFPTVQVSEYPKHEVAYGMLVREELLEKQNLRVDQCNYTLPIGEYLLLKEQDFPPETSTNTLIVDHVADLWRITELKTFDNFIAACRSSLGLNLNLTDQARMILIEKVNQELNRQRSSIKIDNPREIENAQDIEPVFITTLRLVIESINSGFGVTLTSLR